MLKNITATILSKIGKTGQIASAMGCNETAVYNWIRRNQIPVESAWLLYNTQLCTQSEVSYELLIWYMDTWRTRHAFRAFLDTFTDAEQRAMRKEYKAVIKSRAA